MKYLLVLLFLVFGCNKKGGYVTELKDNQCYRNDQYYIKIIKAYQHNSYQVKLLNANREDTTILDNPDMYSMSQLDCTAYDDFKRMIQETTTSNEVSYKSQLLECIDEKLACEERKEAKEETRSDN